MSYKMSYTIPYMGHTCGVQFRPNPLGSDSFRLSICVWEGSSWTTVKDITYSGTHTCKGINDQVETELYKYLTQKALKERVEKAKCCCCKCKCC